MEFIGLVQPYNVRWMNRLELFNEFIILITCYFYFIYSDGLLIIDNPDPAVQEKIADKETMFTVAWANLGMLGFLVFMNVAVMLYKQFYTMKRKCKLCTLKKKQKKAIKEKEDKYRQKLVQHLVESKNGMLDDSSDFEGLPNPE